ncbi:MAG: glycoside hydrolase family 6 protein [Actinomycetota bacterium]|nr:glycoside hydrolase family 6 protein [Actinomycetota bacterium]
MPLSAACSRVRRTQRWNSPTSSYAAISTHKITKLIVTLYRDANPFAGAKLYVDPNSDAKQQADAWRDSRPQDAAPMHKIAAQPTADWFGDWSSDVRSAVDARVTTITSAGALPVLVAYNIPLRDCSGYSAGGARSSEAYRAWIRAFVDGIGSRKAVVILEPDALAALDCLSPQDSAARIALLKDAIEVLATQQRISTYVDAGNAGWIEPAEMADRLSRVGISRVRGFTLNVSNFKWTSDSATYGRAISDLIGVKPFIIDTSRNGLGPDPDKQWCNPEGRGPALVPFPLPCPRQSHASTRSSGSNTRAVPTEPVTAHQRPVLGGPSTRLG